MSRWIVVATVGFWTLGCLLPYPHDTDTPSSSAEPSPDGTTLAVYWDGDLDCPSGEVGSLSLDLNDVGGDGLGGYAGLMYETAARPEDFVRQTLSVEADERDQGAEIRALIVEAVDCTDNNGVDMACPAYLDVVWDRTTVPAVIEGEIPDRDFADTCTFTLLPRF
ncbi:MAG: hypothetical protein ABMB14_10505 [Myxococcota bacterium]